MSIKNFFEKYNIKINNEKLYSEALTHNSYSNEHKLKYSYQRLEFLGDAILQMYVSRFLYLNYSKLSEGELTRLRASTVREETLSRVAKDINLGQIIKLGHGEYITKGYEKPSILADVFEALTAAVYLDQKEDGLLNWLDQTLFKYIKDSNFINDTKDFKSELQELLQSEKRSDLKYITEREDFFTNENKILYTVSVNLDGQKYGIGKGYSKQEAEQNAASDCLSKLRKPIYN
ncbi:ribonuclease III [Mycoplasma feriruminatoris]|uniref:ribonuclease III n=1 Tax=Mycoplasma feriruminatoris TaxID=1179777 RepID=UPI0024200E6B|nr:ribonuclease III [Mycoplasma feriruminatoris]WFQ96014.1 ribonuclease III [Mycoplasma feriruminatoris]